MIRHVLRSAIAVCGGGLAIVSCTGTAHLLDESALQGSVPAIIVNPTATSRAELQRAVSEMLSGTKVLLADDALTNSSVLTIEHRRIGSLDQPPLSGRDLGAPQRFHLLLTGTGCVLVHESDHAAMPLPKTHCVPEEKEP